MKILELTSSLQHSVGLFSRLHFGACSANCFLGHVLQTAFGGHVLHIYIYVAASGNVISLINSGKQAQDPQGSLHTIVSPVE